MAERKPRIGVVDDDDDFAAMMEVLLTEEGYGFVRSPTDDGALEALARTRCDVAVIDLRGVGNAGGLALIRTVRADSRIADLPILVCSADIQLLREHAGELAELPRVASLEKPFRIDALVGAVQRLLSGAATPPRVSTRRPDPSAMAALEELLAHIGRSCVWSATDAWVPDARPGLLRCAGTWVSKRELQPFSMVSRRIRLPLGGGLPGRVWVSGRPAWAEDIASDMNFPRLPTAQRVGIRSAAAVPVVVDDAIAGIVAGYGLQRRAHDPVAIDRLAAAAEEAGPMLLAAAGSDPG